MAHVSAEHLAGHALDLPAELSPEELAHLAGCATCQSELAVLRQVADLSRQEGTAQVPLAPDADVWTRIQSELSADETSGWVVEPRRAAASASEPAVPVDAGWTTADPPAPTTLGPPAESPAAEPRRRPRPRRGLVLLAAAVGLVVGATGVLGIERATRAEPYVNPGPPVEVIASTPLAPLPGQSGTGDAELVRTDAGTELRVRVDAAATGNDFHELWLINTDGKRMISLGTLPASGDGVYPVPPKIAQQLGGYTIVDVSIEPYDGNVAHSRHSLVRGTLPV